MIRNCHDLHHGSSPLNADHFFGTITQHAVDAARDARKAVGTLWHSTCYDSIMNPPAKAMTGHDMSWQCHDREQIKVSCAPLA